MRQVISPQLQFGQVNISTIKFDLKSRDDIPKILRGLQHIYTKPELRKAVFTLLEKDISPEYSKSNGRPGMELWKILVLGVLRLDLNCDYDRLQELVNYHKIIRQMLGHPDANDETYYHMQTLKDNVGLLTEELLFKINEVIVNGGHALLTKKSGEEALVGRCDSFVCLTDVHYPTDINLLLDALRKTLFLTANLCNKYDISELRQYKYNFRKLKYAHRRIQKSKRGQAQEEKIKSSHRAYLDMAQVELVKINPIINKLKQLIGLNISDRLVLNEIDGYIAHAERQLNQIKHRVLNGEVIPHNEKLFSIFETHTEWISKGKAGVAFELGVRVCILEDQHRFILHHRVMKKETDDKVAVLMVEASQKKFPKLKTVSFDKGFHSPDNQDKLSKLLDTVALPRKGRLSKAAKEIEGAAEFKKARKNHSGVESAINALGVHGLDRCPDHGIDGFRNYVALAVLARNIHRLGDILHERELKSSLRKIRQDKACNDAKSQLSA